MKKKEMQIYISIYPSCSFFFFYFKVNLNIHINTKKLQIKQNVNPTPRFYLRFKRFFLLNECLIRLKVYLPQKRVKKTPDPSFRIIKPAPVKSLNSFFSNPF